MHRRDRQFFVRHCICDMTQHCIRDMTHYICDMTHYICDMTHSYVTWIMMLREQNIGAIASSLYVIAYVIWLIAYVIWRIIYVTWRIHMWHELWCLESNTSARSPVPQISQWVPIRLWQVHHFPRVLCDNSWRMTHVTRRILLSWLIICDMTHAPRPQNNQWALIHVWQVRHSPRVTCDNLWSMLFITYRWRRSIGCRKSQVIFCKRATNCRILLRKMTCKDKAS